MRGRRSKLMDVKILDINSVKPYENNPRSHDKNIEELAESIKTFGFKNPILINSDNVIIAGHGRYAAAKKIGLKEVPCIYADDLNEEDCNLFRIVENEASAKANWDIDKLIEEINDCDDVFTGFKYKELEALGEKLVEEAKAINESLDDKLKEKEKAKYKITVVVNQHEISKELYDKIKEEISESATIKTNY